MWKRAKVKEERREEIKTDRKKTDILDSEHAR